MEIIFLRYIHGMMYNQSADSPLARITVDLSMAGWLVSGKGDRWELPSVALSKVHPLLVNRDLRSFVKDETMTRYCTDTIPGISSYIDRARERERERE